MKRAAGRRGQSLVVVLALILLMTMIVSAVQLQVVTQAQVSRPARDLERALQMAEAGANAYLSRLNNGAGAGSAAALVPPVTPANAPTAVLSLTAFKAGVLNHTYSLTWYPQPASGSKPPVGQQQGYYVYQVASGSPTQVRFVAYGWSNGAVRRVQVAAQSFTLFDRAAVYALDPNSGSGGGDVGPALRLDPGASIVGAAGSEGLVALGSGAAFYDGPLILRAGGNTLNPSTSFAPAVLQSGPSLPAGHSGTGTLASAPVRRFSRPLSVQSVQNPNGLETADVAANRWADSLEPGVTHTAGVEYFRTHNNNATGLRYLVKNTLTGKVRQLNDPSKPYTVVATNGGSAWQLSWPTSNGALNSAGMLSGEVFAGIRAYPGSYFFEQISQQAADQLYLRTFADGETPASAPFTVYTFDGLTPNPANPNSGLSSVRDVRFWIGNPTGGGSSPNSSFNTQTTLEDNTTASRFRVYSASHGTLSVAGPGTSSPPKFRVNMLAYNFASGNYYGSVAATGGAYLFGSVIGWQVIVGDNCTIEKEGAFGQPAASSAAAAAADRLGYVVTEWKELL